MRYIQGESREQLMFLPASLDDYISTDNETRSIDLFVNSLNLEGFGFKMKKGDDGRPAYHPSVLLKLFIYGYLNRIRSSRALEKECNRNMELMWLMQRLAPDHNTISNFRKEHADSIRKVFKATVEIAKHFKLIGGKLIAGDSTKLRAQNSKKNNFNRNKIERHLNYIDQKLQHYNDELAEADGDEKKEEIKSAIDKQKERKKNYHALSEALEQSGEDQISVSDPDSKQMIVRNNITEVAYNIQSVTDAEHNIPIDYLVTNNNDSKALGSMMQRAIETLGNNKFVALLDKGYHTGSELSAAQNLGVTTIVAIPDVSSTSMAPDPAYNVSEFTYHKRKHSYTCPQGNELKTNGSWYNKDRRKSRIQVQHFKTPACKTCPVLNQCTKNTRGRGRVIERTEHQDAFFKVTKDTDDPHPELFRGGSGSKGQQQDLLAVESVERRGDKKRKDIKENTRAGRLRMAAVKDGTAPTVKNKVQGWLSAQSVVISDAYGGGNKVSQIVHSRKPRVVPTEQGHVVLPWAHMAISNAKHCFRGIYHSMSRDYLREYLDEFSYKFNNRFNKEQSIFELFDKLCLGNLQGKSQKQHSGVGINEINRDPVEYFILFIIHNMATIWHDFNL